MMHASYAFAMNCRPTPFLVVALALAACFLLSSAEAGPMGHPGETSVRDCSNCAGSMFQAPRLNQFQPLRHHEDRKRYNAAPCCGERLKPDPYLLKTVVVNKKRIPHYFVDANGHRHRRRILTTTYKEIYSDGSCYVWTEQG